jgi:hypothetical protein
VDDAAYVGGKETLWEEMLPFLLERGAAGVIILRDPRDVLASLNHGRGAEYGGRLKPTLFNIRNWRKSAAFALHLERHPRFLWLRYEDLVTRPREVLDRRDDVSRRRAVRRRAVLRRHSRPERSTLAR